MRLLYKDQETQLMHRSEHGEAAKVGTQARPPEGRPRKRTPRTGGEQSAGCSAQNAVRRLFGDLDEHWDKETGTLKAQTGNLAGEQPEVRKTATETESRPEGIDRGGDGAGDRVSDVEDTEAADAPSEQQKGKRI